MKVRNSSNHLRDWQKCLVTRCTVILASRLGIIPNCYKETCYYVTKGVKLRFTVDRSVLLGRFPCLRLTSFSGSLFFTSLVVGRVSHWMKLICVRSENIDEVISHLLGVVCANSHSVKIIKRKSPGGLNMLRSFLYFWYCFLGIVK